MNNALLKQSWFKSCVLLCLFALQMPIYSMEEQSGDASNAEDAPKAENAKNAERKKGEKMFQDWANANTDGQGKVHLHAYIAMPGAFNRFQPKTEEEISEEVKQTVLHNAMLRRALAEHFVEEYARMEGKEKAYAAVEAQRVLAANFSEEEARILGRTQAYAAIEAQRIAAENYSEAGARTAGKEQAYATLEAQRILAANFNEDAAKLAGRKEALAALEAQRILSQRPLQEVLKSGVMKGIEQGAAQVVAQLIVELTQLSIQKGIEYYYQPSAEQQKILLQQQQIEQVLTELEKSLKQHLEQVPKNSVMITTLVDSAIKLGDEEAKKLALAAFKKYAEQTHSVLDMQKHNFEQTKAMAQQLVNS